MESTFVNEVHVETKTGSTRLRDVATRVIRTYGTTIVFGFDRDTKVSVDLTEDERIALIVCLGGKA